MFAKYSGFSASWKNTNVRWSTNCASACRLLNFVYERSRLPVAPNEFDVLISVLFLGGRHLFLSNSAQLECCANLEFSKSSLLGDILSSINTKVGYQQWSAAVVAAFQCLQKRSWSDFWTIAFYPMIMRLLRLHVKAGNVVTYEYINHWIHRRNLFYSKICECEILHTRRTISDYFYLQVNRETWLKCDYYVFVYL